MPKITYVEHDGTRHEVEVDEGLSLMEGAIDNSVPGIDADCGGMCACATCHIYVPANADLGQPGDDEEAMLELAEQTRDTSRLACQIQATAEMDGLAIEMPESQH